MRRLLRRWFRREQEPALRPGVSQGFEMRVRVTFREPLPDELVACGLCRFLGEIRSMHFRGTFVFADPRLLGREQGARVDITPPMMIGVPACGD